MSLVTRIVPAVNTSPFDEDDDDDGLDGDDDDDELLSSQVDDTVRIDSLPSELATLEEEEEVTGSFCDKYLQTRV